MNDTRNKDQLRSYNSFIAARTQRNSCLQELFEFLQDETASQHACRIVCLEFSSTSGPPSRRIIDLDSLALLLGNTAKENNDIRGRILIVEDLSADVVETLGSLLNIDPFFFASHLDTFRANIARPRPSAATLPSTTRSQNFLNLHYHRVIEFENPGPRKVLLRDMNVPRKVKILPRLKGVNVGIAQHCCSILQTTGKDGLWLGKRGLMESRVIDNLQTHILIGLVLVDPPISNSYVSRSQDNEKSIILTLQTRLFQGGSQDLRPGPAYSDDIDPASGPIRASPLESFLYYWGLERPQGFDTKCPTLFSLSYYPLRIIAAEWLVYLELMYHSMKQSEYSPETAQATLGQIAILNDDIYTLQKWARRRIAAAQKIEYTIEFLRYRLSKNDNREHSALLIQDYKRIVSSIDEYSRRLETLVSIATSLIQTMDCRRSLTETINISRLTYLALSFIPLTFVLGLLSMNDSIAPGGKIFGLYFAVTIPLCILVFLIVRPPTSAPAFFAARLWRSRATDQLVV